MILGTSKFCFIFIFYLDAPDFTANPKKAAAAEVPTKPYERNKVRTMLRLRRKRFLQLTAKFKPPPQ